MYHSMEEPIRQWRLSHWIFLLGGLFLGIASIHEFVKQTRTNAVGSEIPLGEPVDEKSVLIIHPDPEDEEIELGSLSTKLKKIKITPVSAMYLHASSPRIKIVEFKCKSTHAKLLKMALEHVALLANLHKMLKMENFYFYELFTTKKRVTSCEQIYLIEGFPNYASIQKHGYYTKSNGVDDLSGLLTRDGRQGVKGFKFGGSRMSHYYKCKTFCQEERAKIKIKLKQGTVPTLESQRFLGDDEASEVFGDQQMMVVQQPRMAMMPQMQPGMVLQQQQQQPQMVQMQPGVQTGMMLQQPQPQMVVQQPQPQMVVQQPQPQMVVQQQPQMVRVQPQTQMMVPISTGEHLSED